MHLFLNKKLRKGVGMKKIHAVIITGIVILMCIQVKAFSSEVYFTPDEIKEKILSEIDACRESIDIATRNITSVDIVNALAKAKERGVEIRIVIDRKRFLSKGILSQYCGENGFAVKILIQKGIMNNNYAIFDSKLLATGSYLWHEKTSRFNCENVIFMDKTPVLVKYQREFDRLFHKGKASPLKKQTYIAEEAEKKRPVKAVSENSEKKAVEGKVIASGYGITITENADGFIDMNFEEFDKIFGVISDLSDNQKENLWRKCEGRKVKWRGRVKYIGWTIINGWLMNTTHGHTSVETDLNPEHKKNFADVKYGSLVTYTGELASLVTKVYPYKLKNGNVIRIEDDTSKPLTKEELTADPYTTILCQGPGKEYIIETLADLESMFGEESGFSADQKRDKWDKFEGKYLSWMGKIIYKHLAAENDLRIGFEQQEGGLCKLELKVKKSRIDNVSGFNEGDTVIYQGMLTKRWGLDIPYIIEDGDILTFK